MIRNGNRHVDISVLLPFDGIDNISITQERDERDKLIYVLRLSCKSGDEQRSVSLKISEVPMSFPIVIDTTQKIEFIQDEEV